MLPKLAYLDDVRAKGEISDAAEPSLRVQIALEHATAQLSEVLETGFDRESRLVEEFFYDWNAGSPGLHQAHHMRLRLSHGFLFEDPGASPDPLLTEVRMAGSLDELDDQDPLDAADLRIENEKGHVVIVQTVSSASSARLRSRTLPGRGYVRVTYDHGFELSNPQLSPSQHGDFYIGVPGWLEDLTATIAYNRFCDMHGDAEMPKIPEAYIQAVVRRHNRAWGGALSPLIRLA